MRYDKTDTIFSSNFEDDEIEASDNSIILAIEALIEVAVNNNYPQDFFDFIEMEHINLRIMATRLAKFAVHVCK